MSAGVTFASPGPVFERRGHECAAAPRHGSRKRWTVVQARFIYLNEAQAEWAGCSESNGSAPGSHSRDCRASFCFAATRPQPSCIGGTRVDVYRSRTVNKIVLAALVVHSDSGGGQAVACPQEVGQMKKILAFGLLAAMAGGVALTTPEPAKAQFVSVGVGFGGGYGGFHGGGFRRGGFYGRRAFYGPRYGFRRGFYGRRAFYGRRVVRRVVVYPAYGYYRPRFVRRVVRRSFRPIVYAYPRPVVRRVVYRAPYYRTSYAYRRPIYRTRVVYRRPVYRARFAYSRPVYRGRVVYRQPFYRSRQVVTRDRFYGGGRFAGRARFDDRRYAARPVFRGGGRFETTGSLGRGRGGRY
jgi:hypothetical protein